MFDPVHAWLRLGLAFILTVAIAVTLKKVCKSSQGNYFAYTLLAYSALLALVDLGFFFIFAFPQTLLFLLEGNLMNFQTLELSTHCSMYTTYNRFKYGCSRSSITNPTLRAHLTAFYSHRDKWNG